MCGRFQLSVKGKHISERFNVEVFDEMYKPCYNCAPSQNLAVITNADRTKLNFYRWGLIPFWANDPKIGYRLINARAESLSEKPAFKHAFRKRRCLIPANGFYEWKKDRDKTPYRVFLKNDELFAMAGIWETWKDAEGKPVYSFSIITTKANPLVEKIHDRMPVILRPQDEEAWLKEKDENTLKKLLVPFDSSEMEAYPVSKKVNSPANEGPEIILPEGHGEQQALF